MLKAPGVKSLKLWAIQCFQTIGFKYQLAPLHHASASAKSSNDDDSPDDRVGSAAAPGEGATKWLAGATVVAAGLVIFGSVTTPWPEAASGVSWTFNLCRRLLAIYLMRRVLKVTQCKLTQSNRFPNFDCEKDNIAFNR